MSVNKVVLVGNVGRDPELKYTPKGTAVCKLSVACGEKFKNQAGEVQERTEWVNVVTWGALAERCGENLAKGAKVYVEGKITTRSWEDKEGNKRSTTEVVASWVEWFSQGKRADQGPIAEGPGEEIPDSAIPF